MSVSACECIKYSPRATHWSTLGPLRPVPIASRSAVAGVPKAWAGGSSFLLGCWSLCWVSSPGVCKEGSGGVFYLKILQRVQVF